ncbi:MULTISPECIES: efflux transporter outer membrane subunit [Ramlibacter]|uniref:Efflux transporter outer membrane subunit n=1 Tax=Ramlibacter pinisoli TaxID=2682844 RepID=A0A6N8J1I4_9BURK|nr:MULTISPECIES: efflux transporter outer membrane subunit [Ramlibacter]MBA2962945.1 efflux transporter outer membrane subunit [Ramlibacter sp. CGMCC 1.13660]MVQ32888.1 efflux transporter outer membrane subunit [Ramlibacter pinisoli]
MTRSARSALRPALLLGPVLLAACAAAPPLTPPRALAELAPAGWQAPLPHAGEPAAIARWWQGWDDPVLARVVDAAQAASPTVAQARTRIAQARAERIGAGAALLPRVDGIASASRAITSPLFPSPATTLQAGLQASWELDLFGGLAQGRTATDARLLGAQAGWHEARVSVAAEAAGSYIAVRTCDALAAVTRDDAGSRAETARLTRLAANAGFQAPADAALADASAADGAVRLAQQDAQCARDRHALAALTAIDEPTLRQLLATAPGELPAPPAIEAVPARLLAQRPDLYTAERDVVAAAADVGQADAQRYPRVTLGGSVTRVRFSFLGTDSTLNTWSAGPLALSLPLFDGGVIGANMDAARARYDEAVSVYQARLRQAVREVESALVDLDSTRQRESDAARAVEGFRISFIAAEARWRSGLGSLIDLELQRRTLLTAQSSWVTLQQERAAALVALYRATGGGWSREDVAAAAPTTPETR